MYHSGIAGGGFALVRAPNGSHEVVDFRETAPAASFEDMYQGNVNGSILGGLAKFVSSHSHLQSLTDKAECQVMCAALSISTTGMGLCHGPRFFSLR